MRRGATLTLFLSLLVLTPVVAGQAKREVSIVVDSELTAPARHGLDELTRVLESKGVKATRKQALRQIGSEAFVTLGPCSDSNAVRELLQAARLSAPRQPEALVVHHVEWNGASGVLICGADARGLMYAALDVAEQVRSTSGGANPLAGIAEAAESPSVAERSLTRMIMNRAETQRYFYSEQFWQRYLDMLARNRYNTFVLMFGYGSAGYFDPPYPFLFDVPEFPGVHVTGITRQEQQRNLDTLHRIIRMTHDRGLDFTLALWTHIFVPGYNNVLSGDASRPGYVSGLTEENLIPYTKVALKAFLKRFPEIDGLQFRVHTESSVTLPQQRHFWTEVLKVVGEAAPQVRVDMRAKGFTDDLIDSALASPAKIRVTTKHWGEQMGLPYHPTQDILANKYKRRHSYADLLRYPRRYEMLYRLWSHGTTRILLWGDPDFARRFAESTRLWRGAGFDIHEPLAMKMGYKLGLHDGPTYDILSHDYRHYDWEFERYWFYYLVFGRLGYNLDAPPRVWRAEFESRFGTQAAPHVETAYREASKVLPRIVAYALRDLSAGFAWAEKQRWEDLPEYIHVRPSDTAQFLGIDEAARFYAAGKSSPKIWPRANSDWFARRSEAVLQAVSAAEQANGASRSKEFTSTLIDMTVLASLAQYHSRRLKAGWNLALFQQTGDLDAYEAALHWERQAIESWEDIVRVTDGVYPDNIIMGRPPRMAGGWKDELTALKLGLEKLEAERQTYRPNYRVTVARLDFGDGPAEEGFSRVSSKDHYSLADGGYGWHHAFLKPSPAPASGSGHEERYLDFLRGPEADEYTYSAFGIDLPNGEYEILFSMLDASEAPADHGPMWIVAQGRESTEHFSIPAGQLVEKRLRPRVVDGRLNVVFNCATDGDWIINSMVVDRVEPVIGHVPVRRTAPGADVTIRATVSGPDPIRDVRLISGSPANGYRAVPMVAAVAVEDRYEASIPASEVKDGLAYYLEASGADGRRVTLPRAGADAPFQVTVTSDNDPPVVRHEAVRKAEPGKPLVILAEAEDASGVEALHVRYRGLNQHQDFASLRMLSTGQRGQYRAEIPGEAIDGRWDFMYFIEAADRRGNAAIYPDLEQETPYVVVVTQ